MKMCSIFQPINHAAQTPFPKTRFETGLQNSLQGGRQGRQQPANKTFWGQARCEEVDSPPRFTLSTPASAAFQSIR
jgi:hypothetical protein